MVMVMIGEKAGRFCRKTLRPDFFLKESQLMITNANNTGVREKTLLPRRRHAVNIVLKHQIRGWTAVYVAVSQGESLDEEE